MFTYEALTGHQLWFRPTMMQISIGDAHSGLSMTERLLLDVSSTLPTTPLNDWLWLLKSVRAAAEATAERTGCS